MNYTINEGGLKEYGPYIRVQESIVLEVVEGKLGVTGEN